MQKDARAVIIGGGIAGASLAYHLTELGWQDIVLLDQGPLHNGTTSHAPGLVGQLRSSVSLTRMLIYSVSLYRTLTINSQPGFFEVGSLRLASSKERLLELKRQYGFAKSVGLPAELLSASEALRLFPLMSIKDIEGALYIPTDGSAQATILAEAMATAACTRGAVCYTQTPVTGIVISAGRVQGIITSQGQIKTENVVIAAGIWSPRIAALAGVSIPLIPMQHQYVKTAPMAELAGNISLCNLRDPDKLIYFRQDDKSLVGGGYERTPAAFDIDKISPNENPTLLEFDPERFDALHQAAQERITCWRDAQLIKRVNGLEAFTPDGEFILGEAPTVAGLWVACGFCAHGVSGAGGVGKMMAEWIVNGEPSLDLWHMDFRRFGAYASGKRYIKERVNEIYRTYYDIFYPAQERSSARKLRLSPLYHRLAELGAVFGEKAGWERPNWFTSNENLAQTYHWPIPQGWASRNWSPAIGAEHQATRERVALFDETSFSKIEVLGPQALTFLQWMTDNQLDQPIGNVTYTQMLNRHGGIECDLTVTRLAEDRFQIVTGTAFGQHDLAWLRRHLPSSGVYLNDVTSSTCCIGVWGPYARELMQQVSEDDLSNSAFPYHTARYITIAEIPALALRVTYVGELGWEIYTPSEFGLKLWDTLWQAGQPLGVVAAGYRAIDSLRLEKGYRYWSADIHSEYNPYEAGLGFAVKLQKGEFLGRTALEQIKQKGIARKLSCIVIDNPTIIALGGEPILADERVLGRVTSGGYGYTVRQS
ncbi:MAG: FAD-dependent oxidoreductase, partial [Acidobacteriota bacterium]